MISKTIPEFLSPNTGPTRQRRPKEKIVPNPKAKLREQLHEVMRFHHYSERTEETYWQWIVRFLKFHRDHPHLTPALFPPSEGAKREKRWSRRRDALRYHFLTSTEESSLPPSHCEVAWVMRAK